MFQIRSFRIRCVANLEPFHSITFIALKLEHFALMIIFRPQCVCVCAVCPISYQNDGQTNSQLYLLRMLNPALLWILSIGRRYYYMSLVPNSQWKNGEWSPKKYIAHMSNDFWQNAFGVCLWILRVEHHFDLVSLSWSRWRNSWPRVVMRVNVCMWDHVSCSHTPSLLLSVCAYEVVCQFMVCIFGRQANTSIWA